MKEVNLKVYCGDSIPEHLFENAVLFPEIKDGRTLFPLKQYDWVYEYFKDCEGDVTIITNSPYILTSLNNILYAQSLRKEGVNIDEVWKYNHSKINVIEAICFCNDYEIQQENIFDEFTGLFGGNELDSASDYVGNDFDLLLKVYRDFQISFIKNKK